MVDIAKPQLRARVGRCAGQGKRSLPELLVVSDAGLLIPGCHVVETHPAGRPDDLHGPHDSMPVHSPSSGHSPPQTVAVF